MINQVDDMLRHLLDDRLNNPPQAWPIQVEVRPPNDDWRAHVNSLGQPAVNIYMAELREDREQRTTAYHRRPRPEPYRVDCHYLVSAWIPSNDPAFATPTVVEDWLLGEMLRIIANEAPLNATRVYNGSLPPTIAPVLIDYDLRTEIAPPEGYHNLADFWTGVGQGNVWHPCVHLIVTLPLVRSDRPVGPPVTTVSTSYQGGAETSIDIGGTVTGQSGAPVANAWARLETPTGVTIATTSTNDLGQFYFNNIAAGDYLIRVRSPGLAEATAAVTVPSTTSPTTYDIAMV